MSVLGERIKKLRGGENEMAFGEVVNFIPVLRWKYRGVPWSLKLQGGFFLKTQKSPAFNRASLSYLSLGRFLPCLFHLTISSRQSPRRTQNYLRPCRSFHILRRCRTPELCSYEFPFSTLSVLLIYFVREQKIVPPFSAEIPGSHSGHFQMPASTNPVPRGRPESFRGFPVRPVQYPSTHVQSLSIPEGRTSIPRNTASSLLRLRATLSGGSAPTDFDTFPRIPVTSFLTCSESSSIREAACSISDRARLSSESVIPLSCGGCTYKYQPSNAPTNRTIPPPIRRCFCSIWYPVFLRGT